MDSEKEEAEEGEENGESGERDDLIAKENEVAELQEFLKTLLLDVLHVSLFSWILQQEVFLCLVGRTSRKLESGLQTDNLEASEAFSPLLVAVWITV